MLSTTVKEGRGWGLPKAVKYSKYSFFSFLISYWTLTQCDRLSLIYIFSPMLTMKPLENQNFMWLNMYMMGYK